MTEYYEIKTVDEARKAYEERFGGWPYFLLMGADDKEIVWLVRRALRMNKEIEADDAEGEY